VRFEVLPQGKNPGTHWTGGRLVPECLDVQVKRKILLCWELNLHENTELICDDIF
jgi:hypothetical protein